MNDTTRANPWAIVALGSLQALIGLSAVAGGIGLVSDPSGANLGMDSAWLRGSPFADYLIPGIVLLAVNGIGSLVGAVASFVRARRAGQVAVVLGGALLIWIGVQVYIIGLTNWLQPLYFGFGVVEMVLGVRVGRGVLYPGLNRASL